MISEKCIKQYSGALLCRGEDSLYISPHALLQPYISCYTITFPKNMPEEFTIMPSASTRFIFSVTNNNIENSFVGVNTKAFNAGNNASKMKMLLLIEFHIGALFHFIKTDQHELTDSFFALTDLNKTFAHKIENILLEFESIESIVAALDKMFLDNLNFCGEKIVTEIKNKILTHNGDVTQKDLSTEFCYSEKHIRRLFLKYIGTGPKMFSRIVRINHAMRLLQNPTRFTDIAVKAGFFDQSHFIHDFKHICGITPMEYMKNMSVFYNDKHKI